MNTGDYDSKLAKAKRSSDDFASNIGGKVAGMVGKFAAGIGVAMGGVEAFNKMMNSTQTTGDLLRGTMQGLKTSVDEFFYSLNTGNLRNFLSGLDEMIGKARDAYAAMDQLGNTQISYGVLSSKNQASIAEAQYVAKNKFAPTSERIGAFGDWKTAIESEQGNIQALQRELINAATTAVESRINANIEVTLEDIIKAFETDLLKPNSRAEVKSRAEMGFRNYNVNAGRSDWTQEQKDALAEIQKENIITYTMLEKYNDEELQQIAQQIQQYYALINAVKNLGREYNETANEFNNANKGISGFNPVASLSGYTVYSGGEASKNFVGGTSGAVKAAAGSLAAIDAEIKKAQQEYANTASAAAREAALRTIQELQDKKGLIELHARVKMPDVGDGKSGSLADLAGGLPKTLGQVHMPDFKKKKEEIEDMNSALGSTGEIFGGLSSILASSGEEIGAWIAGTAGNIANMIMQLQALATAEATTQAAKYPFPANIAAIATIVATIASVFSSLPKFAEGGVVGGSSYFGDKLIARVNSGETILTKKQTARALSMMDGGNVRVSGDVRLNGKDIYISLRNYMSASGNRL